jgi:peptide chain release factor 1
MAREDIISKVTKHYQTILDKQQSINRKEQVGSGMRGDKIRTYRFQDDVVTDHRTDKKSSVKKILSGNFDLLW